MYGAADSASNKGKSKFVASKKESIIFSMTLIPDFVTVSSNGDEAFNVNCNAVDSNITSLTKVSGADEVAVSILELLLRLCIR